MNNVTLHFHIGRGGRFNNPGHKKFVGVATMQDVLNQKSNLIFDGLDEDGTPGYCDSSGHFLISYEEAKKETGYLEWDNDYDTDILINAADATASEILLVLRAGYIEPVRFWISQYFASDALPWEKIDTENLALLIEDLDTTHGHNIDIRDYCTD